MAVSTSHAIMTQRFLVFPGGMTGAALLLLRFSVAISLAIPPYGRVPPYSLRALGLGVLALALAVGFYTRFAASLSVVVAIILFIGDANLPATSLISFALPAIALAMIGPGAASFDARLFGRRKISLPR